MTEWVEKPAELRDIEARIAALDRDLTEGRVGRDGRLRRLQRWRIMRCDLPHWEARSRYPLAPGQAYW